MNPAVAVPAGDGFSEAQLASLRQEVVRAGERSGLEFVLYVGPLRDGRAAAVELLMQRPDPDGAVLVAVDPAGRVVEIVTGARAQRQCDERACGLAAASMTASFGAGDLLGGIRNGLDLLATRAYQPRPLHVETL